MPSKTSQTRGLNTGDGIGVFSSISGSSLAFKSLSGGSNVTITGTTDSIIISSTGGGGTTGLTGSTNGLSDSGGVVKLGGTLTDFQTFIYGDGTNGLYFGGLFTENIKINDTSFSNINNFNVLLSSTGSTCCSQFIVNKSSISMCTEDSGIDNRYTINQDGHFFTASDSQIMTITSSGATYNEDYSSGNTVGPRWIPDAAWVTGQTGGGTTTGLTGSTNGLSDTDGVVSLGGTLITTTNINADGNQFCLYNSNTTTFHSEGCGVLLDTVNEATLLVAPSSVQGGSGISIGLTCSADTINYFTIGGGAFNHSRFDNCPNAVPTVAWVTGQTGGGGTLTGAANGVCVDGNNVVLGGTLTGNTNITGSGTHGICFSNVDNFYIGESTISGFYGGIKSDINCLEIGKGSGPLAGDCRSSICFTDCNGIEVYFKNNLNPSNGFYYAEDYSACFSWNPRWIPDAAWVTGQTTSPGGTNTHVQYNNNGSFSGSSNFIFDGTNVQVAGDVCASDFVLTSDLRCKTNIIDYVPYNTSINYKQFELCNCLGQTRFGVVAQELKEIYPEVVRENNDGYLSVSYIDLLIREVAYLKNKITELENKIK